MNHVLWLLVRRWLARPLVDKYLSGRVRARDVLLFSVRALNLSRADARFHLAEHDLLTPFPPAPGRHIVRAMNVLNPRTLTPMSFA